MLMLDSHWMPRLMPETAEATKQDGQDGDDHHEHRGADLADPAVGGQAAADLEGPQAQRRGGTEQAWRRLPGC